MRFDKVCRPIDSEVVGKLYLKGDYITTVEGQAVLRMVN